MGGDGGHVISHHSYYRYTGFKKESAYELYHIKKSKKSGYSPRHCQKDTGCSKNISQVFIMLFVQFGIEMLENMSA